MLRENNKRILICLIPKICQHHRRACEPRSIRRKLKTGKICFHNKIMYTYSICCGTYLYRSCHGSTSPPYPIARSSIDRVRIRIRYENASWCSHSMAIETQTFHGYHSLPSPEHTVAVTASCWFLLFFFLFVVKPLNPLCFNAKTGSMLR